jgi:hypothetical protein
MCLGAYLFLRAYSPTRNYLDNRMCTANGEWSQRRLVVDPRGTCQGVKPRRAGPGGVLSSAGLNPFRAHPAAIFNDLYTTPPSFGWGVGKTGGRRKRTLEVTIERKRALEAVRWEKVALCNIEPRLGNPGRRDIEPSRGRQAPSDHHKCPHPPTALTALTLSPSLISTTGSRTLRLPNTTACGWLPYKRPGSLS